MKTRMIPSMMTVAVISVMLLFAGSAFAGRGFGMGQGCQQGIGNNCKNFKNLNLTDEQKTKLDAERTRFWNETTEIRTQINTKEDEMRVELLKPEVNRETVQNIQAQISALQSDFNKLRADHLINMRAISPELIKQCTGFGSGCGKMGACMGMRGTGMGNMMNCPAASTN